MTATAAQGESNGLISAGTVSSVGRGGAVNLVGAVVYGAANFVLVWVLNREFGTQATGVILIGIAMFNISLNFAQAGCSTGFIRWMSRHRALGSFDQLRATVIVGLVPVVLVATLLAVVVYAAAPTLAQVFSDSGQASNVTTVFRAVAPFLPLAAVYMVIVQATRGFDTMLPQAAIEKVGRALLLPVLAWVAASAGLGSDGFARLWAATFALALVPAGFVFLRLVNRTVASQGVQHRRPTRRLAREYWAFTAPRAVGQVSEVVVNWLDTLLIGGLVSARTAGIYNSATRYMLPGQFTADALMQVMGSRISGLLSTDRHREAEALLRITTGWQTALTWPTYLVVIFFAPPLLEVFGADKVVAEPSVIALSVAMLTVSMVGPVQSVILMSGRSRQAMFNTLFLVAVNLTGNLLLVPRFGFNASGFVWATTIVLASGLPAWQSHRFLGIVANGPGSRRVAAAALGTVGAGCLASRLVIGPSWCGLLVGGVGGAIPYTSLVWRMREELELPALIQGFARRKTTLEPS